jgi:hypothetical protein
MSVGYNIGIELSDGSMHWTTIVDASTLTVQITDALSLDVAIGAAIYTYQTKLNRPLKILSAWRRIAKDVLDTPITVIERKSFMDLSSKISASTPVQIYYSPELVNGVLYIYPQFSTGKDIIVINYQSPLEDFDAAADEPQIPQFLYDALLWRLSYKLSFPFGTTTMDRAQLKREADETELRAFSFDMEEGSIFINAHWTRQ